MLDSIYIGMTGLSGYAEGLRLISNNSANLDTPGFKGSTLQFGDLFQRDAGATGSGGEAMIGSGLNTFGSSLNFKQGELRSTGNSLDLAIDGSGLFTLRDGKGDLHYTRDGEFQFDTTGVLVDRTDGSRVVSVDASGAQGIFQLDGHRIYPPAATTTITFENNIDAGSQATETLENVTVIDGAGMTHNLSIVFTAPTAQNPGEWGVALMDGTTPVDTGTLYSTQGIIDTSRAVLTMHYHVASQNEDLPLVLDFSKNVTAFQSTNGDSNKIAVRDHDGYVTGGLTNVSFDDQGTLVYTYSNGKTTNGPKLALARFDTTAGVKPHGSNQFDVADAAVWHFGASGDAGFGALRSGQVEISNVDLSQEFSDLVVMQRGYQASSQVVSTANEMIQQLFSMSNGK